jgi:AcrR family transcriptional regulator
MKWQPAYRVAMSTTRGYRMSARATSAARTRARILHAVIEVAQEKLTLEIRLDDVARRAGTTVQTVLRHFGSRESLLDAAIAAGAADIAAERAVGTGDIDTGFRRLIDHYEERGDFMTRMVAQEQTDARIRSITADGRRFHREWVAGLFAAELAARPEAARSALLDLLVVATDLATWRLLRRDRGLDRATTEARMRTLTAAVLATPDPEE